ncbi:MAG: benzoyl-CoA-dihydrodiol lyase [Proteobacteria bacterium]|nr:benzoyl-CoA-dihydrodiol lyase [Pseudomonadota bacterium]MBI3496395.1 benzoyl-CoA-dihydrodiol lyase [Pseudomonadota bacterium]
MISFETDPSRYRHWKLGFEGPVATLALDVSEDGGIREGYKLKLNSYDLGVDIELNDALQRIRFEHPETRTVVITSAKERMFSAGANIYMLAASSHAWKVNFCKFTNETRNGMEDSSERGRLKFLAALNGPTAGGGYELALACDEILMVDDRSSTVSLPEVPLLGVLPGTGGLTRLTDKRRVRRDLADLFCTTAEGVRAERALEWRLVDRIARPANFAGLLAERARVLAADDPVLPPGPGVKLEPLQRSDTEDGWRYGTLAVVLDRERRTARLDIAAPTAPVPADIAAIRAEGCRWWPLRFARELDDAILLLRVNHPEIGLWLIRTSGDIDAVLAMDALMLDNADDWLVGETMGFLRRTIRRLDVSSRSLYAVAERGSCFAGLLYELALASDRFYLLDAEGDPPSIVLDRLNVDGRLAMGTGRTRLDQRFAGDGEAIAAAEARLGQRIGAAEARRLGLATLTPDELDWADEMRLAIEERVSLSPDALSGLEASLRFGGGESLESKIFGRLSAWQNWVFGRPNAVGEKGALKLFGTGSKAKFDWDRV